MCSEDHPVQDCPEFQGVRVPPEIGTDDYKPCKGCRRPTIITVLHQTRGVCMDCFASGSPMQRFREAEIAVRGGTVNMLLPPSYPARKTKARNARRNATARPVQSDLARLRACRRMANLFPDLFAVLYAEERWKAGLTPKATPVEGLLDDAVQTYAAFVAYHLASRREPDDGTENAT